ncbi:hypothetical protein ILUMI_04996 [Ignelater luminosus]|uniref:SCP domain-containing protein n=1 Tax=Ignelater luminosus TaxID=2038154 RepID=A0A8K0D7X8_IGNLU|nr:hypothetical protein ILUMI_04996 [Ignelater luminosus]
MDSKRIQQYLLLVVIIQIFFVVKTSACGGKILLRSGPASEYDKQIILDTHNALRQLVALGQIPGHPQASNLQEMKWDDELAYRAEQWSHSCFSERHDEGRHLRRFPVGQNIATIWTTKKPTSTYEVVADYPDAIKRWFDEYRNYRFGKIYYSDDTTGHYTQMVWANSNLVGCGYAFYYDPAKGFTKNYICNYGPSGNVMGEAPYRIGPPSCSSYGMQDSERYYGLCKKTQQYLSNFQTINVPQFNNVNDIIELVIERAYR